MATGPVKMKTKKIHHFIYSEELDFYAALYPISLGEMVIGGKNPLEAEKWPRMCNMAVDEKYEFRWCGRYLCLGDVHSAIIHTMTPRGVKHVSRLILPDNLMYAPSFGTDGKGTLYIIPGEFCNSPVIRYDGNGKYYGMPFKMSGHDRFDEGCIPVPDTSRLLLLGSYTARSCSGIWIEPGLLDLDMATQNCRIAPLRIGDGSFRTRSGCWWRANRTATEPTMPVSGTGRRTKCYASVPACWATNPSNPSMRCLTELSS